MNDKEKQAKLKNLEKFVRELFLFRNGNWMDLDNYDRFVEMYSSDLMDDYSLHKVLRDAQKDENITNKEISQRIESALNIPKSHIEAKEFPKRVELYLRYSDQYKENNEGKEIIPSEFRAPFENLVNLKRTRSASETIIKDAPKKQALLIELNDKYLKADKPSDKQRYLNRIAKLVADRDFISVLKSRLNEAIAKNEKPKSDTDKTELDHIKIDIEQLEKKRKDQMLNHGTLMRNNPDDPLYKTVLTALNQENKRIQEMSNRAKMEITPVRQNIFKNKVRQTELRNRGKKVVKKVKPVYKKAQKATEGIKEKIESFGLFSKSKKTEKEGKTQRSAQEKRSILDILHLRRK